MKYSKWATLMLLIARYIDCEITLLEFRDKEILLFLECDELSQGTVNCIEGTYAELLQGVNGEDWFKVQLRALLPVNQVLCGDEAFGTSTGTYSSTVNLCEL
jgi:hypothetical protein